MMRRHSASGGDVGQRFARAQAAERGVDERLDGVEASAGVEADHQAIVNRAAAVAAAFSSSRSQCRA
jgi:hypothetical protein